MPDCGGLPDFLSGYLAGVFARPEFKETVKLRAIHLETLSPAPAFTLTFASGCTLRVRIEECE